MEWEDVHELLHGDCFGLLKAISSQRRQTEHVTWLTHYGAHRSMCAHGNNGAETGER